MTTRKVMANGAFELLIRILRAAGFRVLEADESRAVVRRGNRTIVVPAVESPDSGRFAAVLDMVGMSRATVDALLDVGLPPPSRR